MINLTSGEKEIFQIDLWFFFSGLESRDYFHEMHYYCINWSIGIICTAVALLLQTFTDDAGVFFSLLQVFEESRFCLGATKFLAQCTPV